MKTSNEEAQVVRTVGDRAFVAAHSLVDRFLVERSGGIPFEDFKHPFLLDNEINYKRTVLERSRAVLKPNEWAQLAKKPGRIISQVRNAFSPQVSSNLLEHRYKPPKFLSAEQPTPQIVDLEKKLAEFFESARKSREAFASAFDSLAEFLRERSLGCQWAPMSYLAFLANDRCFFPVRSQQFDKLLAYYGVEGKIEGTVSWERYRLVLDVAEDLSDRLEIFGSTDATEIQSYMWVAAHLISSEQPVDSKGELVPDFNAELTRRQRKVRSEEANQRIGVLGEKHVFCAEKRKLEDAGKEDLAAKVDPVSMNDDTCGFDIRSFDLDGGELHIEVKATSRSEDNDFGFWLTENERATAEMDPRWRLYRVWGVGSSPCCKDFGNVVRDAPDGWSIRPSQYFVRFE